MDEHPILADGDARNELDLLKWYFENRREERGNIGELFSNKAQDVRPSEL